MVSVTFSAASLWWSVVSFRRGGSRLRVHALLYREVLLVWIFNGGRTADTVEHVVLGGVHGGIRGHDLTNEFEAPFMLAPGQSKRTEITTASLPAERLALARSGWVSLWLLLGSMRERRVELLPLRQHRPPSVGWRLAPRTAGVRRYVPTIAAMAVFLCSAPGAPRALGFSVLAMLLVVRGYAGLLQPTFGRGRVERWFTAIAVPVAAGAAAIPDASAAVLALYGSGAVVLAVPGAVEVALEHAMQIRKRLRRPKGSKPRG